MTNKGSRASTNELAYRNVPFGATVTKEGTLFSVWSPNATEVVLHFFDKNEVETFKLKMPERKGGTWFAFVPNISEGDLYAIEPLGPYDPDRGLYFKEGRYLTDPYAKCLSKSYKFNYSEYTNNNSQFIPKSVVVSDDFDWQDVPKPSPSRENLILFELNVKGATILNEMVPHELRGKYLGLCHESVINHFKKLGITGIQLNPIYAFISERHLVKQGLVNYWGYNPVNYFAPEPRYAVNPLNAVNEFKTMVRELHRHGISVILDVVYNHTGEAGRGGPVLSLKGLDARNYYTFPLNPDGTKDYSRYYDVSGCGNSVNADEKIALNLITDSLTYWATVMKVDGFRFDLGAAINRETHGSSFHTYEPNSAFFKACFCIDAITNSILIAEPWDCGPNGYRLGQFPIGWSEQNDKFRDCVRKFWRGDPGLLPEFATRVMGSRDIYGKTDRSIKDTVNFVTYHDGFTLEDLVSYNQKHNEANGEENRDGCDANWSSNSGVEGHTDDPNIKALRWQLKRNLMATILLSQGIPHLLGGDEFSKTQDGNNNVYCQDNPTGWTKWDYSEENKQFINFISRLNRFRRSSSIAKELILEDDKYHISNGNTYRAAWYKYDGNEMDDHTWNDPNTDSVILRVTPSKEGDLTESMLVLINQHYVERTFVLPPPPVGGIWKEYFDSSTPDGLPLDMKNEIKIAFVSKPCIKVFILFADPNYVAEEDIDAKYHRHFNRGIKYD